MRDAVAAFARRLDPSNPITVAFDDAIVAMLVSDPTLPDAVGKVLALFVDRAGRRIMVKGPAIHLMPEVTLALSMAL